MLSPKGREELKKAAASTELRDDMAAVGQFEDAATGLGRAEVLLEPSRAAVGE